MGQLRSIDVILARPKRKLFNEGSKTTSWLGSGVNNNFVYYVYGYTLICINDLMTKFLVPTPSCFQHSVPGRQGASGRSSTLYCGYSGRRPMP